MKNMVLLLALTLGACGGSDSSIGDKISDKVDEEVEKVVDKVEDDVKTKLCEQIKTNDKACPAYGVDSNCTGAQQHYECDSTIDADKDGLLCEDEFGDTCKVPAS